MARIIVSLLSENPIPNVIFIKETKYDKLLFITTEKMSKKRIYDNTINALKENLQFSSQNLLIKEDDIDNIFNSLLHFSKIGFFTRNDEILVNLTDGTKIMAIGVYDFFKDYRNARFYYLPIGKNKITQVYPATESTNKVIYMSIGVKDYLEACGLKIYGQDNLKNKSIALKNKQFCKNTFNKCKNSMDFSLLNTLHKGKYSKGKWFEEYIFNAISSIVPEGKGDVFINVKVKRPFSNAKNEFDILFTYKNNLYVIECKAIDFEHFNSQKNKAVLPNEANKELESILYKIGALRSDFGLSVKTYLVLLTSKHSLNGKLMKFFNPRSKSLNITVISREDLEPEKLEVFFKKELAIK
jgi:hypothetical protein